MDPISIFAIIGGIGLFIGLIGSGKIMGVEIPKVAPPIRVLCIIIGITMLAFSLYSYKEKKVSGKNASKPIKSYHSGKIGKK